MVLGNITVLMMVFWMGWQVLWWVGAGLAVELALIKFLFKIEWARALKMWLWMNLVSTVAGLLLMVGGAFLLGVAYGHVGFWILLLGSVTFFNAYLHDKVSDFLLPMDNNPFSLRWLMVVNGIGTAIGWSCMFWISVWDWEPLFW